MKARILRVKYFLAFVILTLSMISGIHTIAYGAPDVPPTMSETGDGNYYNVIFPPGTIFKGILQTGISTASCNIDDEFSLIIPDDIQVGEAVCVPRASKFIGKVARMGRAKAGKNGFFHIIIEVLRFPDGQETSVLAHIWAKGGTGIIGGELTERAGYRKMQHSIEGVGDIAQLVPDGPRVMGKDTELLPGSEWFLVLDKNLKLLVEKYE